MCAGSGHPELGTQRLHSCPGFRGGDERDAAGLFFLVSTTNTAGTRVRLGQNRLRPIGASAWRYSPRFSFPYLPWSLLFPRQIASSDWPKRAVCSNPATDRVVMNMAQIRDGSNLVRIRTLMPDPIATEVPLECPDRGRVPGLCDRVPNSVLADTHLLTRSSEMP
jgi:hypothetical protein